ncbi:MAG: ribonuclease III [candidate division Zixibacteria bacterium RBG_16_40_9]|nr:MAG: ribonuclease III [candidate division Zixibacteria bacterium RBG_16_40_9]
MKFKWLSIFKKNPLTSENSLKKLQKKIGYNFNNLNLLKEAVTHKSYIKSGGCPNSNSNERLEFLGDSILGLVICEFLYKKFPDKSEGELTKLKAGLVNEVTLSNVGRNLGLGEFLYLSPEEEKSGGRERPSLVADGYEALIGAVYLDGGLQAISKLISSQILTRFRELTDDRQNINYKGELLEYLQALGWGMPEYEVEEAIGPDHQKKFTIAAIAKGEKVGVGEGASKKEAEQKAARMAIEKLYEQKKTEISH